MAAPWPVEANHGAEVVADPERPELGRFLRATCSLACGDLIVKESPLFRLRGGGRSMPSNAGAAANAMRSAQMFVPAGNSSVLKRLRRESPKNEDEDTTFVRSVLQFNSFAAGVGGMDKVTFAMLAKANHSCAPNCIVDGDDGTLRALRPIAKGDELTISYLTDAMLLKSRQLRRTSLAEGWEFHCRCSRCVVADVSGDDVRRFSVSCPECSTGEAVARGEDCAELLCVPCMTVIPAAVSNELLNAERAAVRALISALSGDLEEEEEGQELIRCHAFAQKHPLHYVSLDLANEFAFPDAVAAKEAVLHGLRCVFGDVPSQLAVDTGRELADLLHIKGDSTAALEALNAAAGVASILDGRSSADEVLQDWKGSSKERDQRSYNDMSGPPIATRDAAWLARDMDLDMGFKPGVNAAPKQTSACSNCQCTEKQMEMPRKIPDAVEHEQTWFPNTRLAQVASVLVVVSVFSFWQFRRRKQL